MLRPAAASSSSSSASAAAGQGADRDGDKDHDQANESDRGASSIGCIWYVQLFGWMLQSLTANIIDPYVHFQRHVEWILNGKTSNEEQDTTGEGDTMDTDDEDRSGSTGSDEGHTEDGDGANGAEGDRSSSKYSFLSGKRTSPDVAYREIQDLLRLVREDALFRRLDLSEYTHRLERKVRDIDSFAKKTWDIIARIFDDDEHREKTDAAATAEAREDDAEDSASVAAAVASSFKRGKKPEDPIIGGLEDALAFWLSKESPVCNVEPIGLTRTAAAATATTTPVSPVTDLTRNVVENAIVCRKWYVRLRKAETSRERSEFVKGVIASFDALPETPLSAIDGLGDWNTKRSGLEPRVKDMSDKYETFANDEVMYDAILERAPEIPENVTETPEHAIATALDELGKQPFVGTIEEKLLILKDMNAWASKAREVLAPPGGKPEYDEVMSLKRDADSITDGKSPSRMDVASTLEENAAINAMLRDFAKAEMLKRYGVLQGKIDSIISIATVWKDKAKAIVLALRIFGNPFAGEQIASSKLPVMVDIKRIADLLAEHDSIGVALDEETLEILQKVHAESVDWSSKIIADILDDTRDYKECLALVQGIGRDRPKGIIVNPTRQVIDMIAELLTWYDNAKRETSSAPISFQSIYPLLLEGREVLAQYAEKNNIFVGRTPKAIEVLIQKINSKGSSRTIPVSKLEANNLTGSVLRRLLDYENDVKGGHTMLLLLEYLWIVLVEEFNTRGESSPSDIDDLTIVGAKNLLQCRPLTRNESGEGLAALFEKFCYEEVDKLNALLAEAEQKEAEAFNVLSRSKHLLRDSLSRPEEVRSHLLALREYQGIVRNRTGVTGSGLRLDLSLEQQFENDIKLFGWLDKVYQYPVLRTREIDDDCDFDEDEKVPWEVLVGLAERAPQSSMDGGDFSYVGIRVKELYDAASAWQQEISKLTMLSLRGGKRRKTSELSSPNSKTEITAAATEEEESNQIDLKKVAELSHDPILYKVTMPREDAIRQMLEDTMKFELQLHDLLGKDFVCINADRAAYPESGSLVGKDGSFLLYRLVGSPLYAALKESLAAISDTANDVCAETPGKATFDWITKAVSWIDSLVQGVSRLDSPPPLSEERKGRLIIPGSEARKLLSQGGEILLNVPEDLRRVLSKYKIYVSASKEGKLTVRSKKGGAHHAIGVTAICWCPILFDSLKADCGKLERWQRSVTAVAAAFTSYMKEPSAEEDQLLLQFHGFLDEVIDLLWQLQDLVVYPSSNLVDSTHRLYTGIVTRLKSSNADIAKKYSAEKYETPSAVVDNRFLLLDSLVHRKSNAPDAEAPPVPPAPKEGTFRNALKSLMEKALRKGVSVLGLSPDSEDAAALCAVKAWEIEYKLFDLFQAEVGESQISVEYRERGRALKRSIEDTSNIAFCVRVLTGQTSTDTLVRMTSEELANAKTKEDRAKAAAVAKQSVVLTGGSSTTSNVRSPKKEEAKALDTRLTPKPNNTEKASSNVPGGAKESPSCSKIDDDHKTSTYNESGTKAVSSPQPGSGFAPTSPPVHRSSPFMLGEATKSSRNVLPPPPPPSLAVAATIQSPQQHLDSHSGGTLISNVSGSDHFQVTLGSRKFTACFYTESGPADMINGSLPEELVEKGRLRIDEFTKFLRTKIESGRWATIPMRLATFSDKHAREYKKFYKDYESRQRIAMVPIPPGDSKLFLVTPRFHRAAKGINFDNSTATYAVVLTRR